MIRKRSRWSYGPLRCVGSGNGSVPCSRRSVWRHLLPVSLMCCLVTSRARRAGCGLTGCPKGTSIETLVRVEGTRWRIEEGFETGKNELGLDHIETRSWHGWHRHISLVLLAYAMIAAVNIKPTARRKSEIPNTKELIRWTVQEIRRLAFKLAQRQIKPAHILAWSILRRAHQAVARRSHLKSKMEL